MALPAYGVVIGTLDHFAREDPNDFGSWYHGKIYVQTPGGLYEAAVDVSTPSGIKVQYRTLDGLSGSAFAPILALSDGWHPLASTSTSGALDYVRSPLLGRRSGCVTVRALDPVLSWLSNLWRSTDSGWIDSTGDNALDVLDAKLTGSIKLFVFGAPYTTGLGVHDVHMNQGDPPGQFQHLDAIWQDGGTIVQRPGGGLDAVMIKFETQSLNTDANGLPI